MIENCEYSTWFNACSQCEPGYSYGYDKEKGILYDTCVLNQENYDCLSYDSTEEKCRFCKKGTILNADRVCEQISPHKCKSRHFKHRQKIED